MVPASGKPTSGSISSAASVAFSGLTRASPGVVLRYRAARAAVLPATAAPAAGIEQYLGERVRARRHARGWTLDGLAERSGVSRRMLVNVEQGATNPSIATLLRLSEALAIGLPSLVAPNDGEVLFEINRAGTRPPLWTGPHGGQAFLTAGVTAPDVVELWDWTLAPGDAHASEPHVAGTRELLVVIDGEVILAVAGQDAVLRAGDAVSFAGDAAHGYRNDGATAARFALTVFEPAVDAEMRR
jgi:transcriptional regulator with XRE-family HTH domain